MTKDTPPTFLAHTNADTGVPAENSLLFALALRKAGVPVELHLFERGPHGLGLGDGTAAVPRPARARLQGLAQALRDLAQEPGVPRQETIREVKMGAGCAAGGASKDSRGLVGPLDAIGFTQISLDP